MTIYDIHKRIVKVDVYADENLVLHYVFIVTLKDTMEQQRKVGVAGLTQLIGGDSAYIDTLVYVDNIAYSTYCCVKLSGMLSDIFLASWNHPVSSIATHT